MHAYCVHYCLLSLLESCKHKDSTPPYKYDDFTTSSDNITMCQ